MEASVMRAILFYALLIFPSCRKTEPPKWNEGAPRTVVVEGVDTSGTRPPELPADWPLCSGSRIAAVVRTPQDVTVWLAGDLQAQAIFDCYLAHKELRVVSDRALGSDARALRLEDSNKHIVNVIAIGNRSEDVSLMVAR
jgi:hypothetical protein